LEAEELAFGLWIRGDRMYIVLISDNNNNNNNNINNNKLQVSSADDMLTYDGEWKAFSLFSGLKLLFVALKEERSSLT